MSVLDAQTYERFWKHDGTLWSSDPSVVAFIEKFMGWTDVCERMLPRVPELKAFAEEVWAEGLTDVVVCGMGGSSLGSLVLREVFSQEPRMHVHILDSTDPATVLQLRRDLPIESTLFLVASKSGSTVEPKSFEDYFWGEAQKVVGEHAASHFVAITDPGSKMEAQSKERGYRHIWLGEPEIGGRFSVLSLFGLVTATLIGADVEGFIRSALSKGRSSAESGADHEGFRLGLLLAEAALVGRDKVTLITSSGLESFGLWAEQLVAESTGKEGKGILPVACEPLGPVADYGADRVFVGLRWDDSRGVQVAHVIQALQSNGAPVVDRHLSKPEDLGGELFVWEVATAVAGIVLGINPFDQPNVERAKVIARDRLSDLSQGKQLEMPKDKKMLGRLEVYGSESLHEFLSGREPGTYVAFLAYLTQSDATNAEFDRLRIEVRESTGFVTTFGYGPRYLHSTGQYHKGGTDNGVFVLVLGADEVDMPIPGMGATFSQLKRAQAIGDYDALKEAGRDVFLVVCRDPGDLSILSV